MFLKKRDHTDGGSRFPVLNRSCFCFKFLLCFCFFFFKSSSWHPSSSVFSHHLFSSCCLVVTPGTDVILACGHGSVIPPTRIPDFCLHFQVSPMFDPPRPWFSPCLGFLRVLPCNPRDQMTAARKNLYGKRPDRARAGWGASSWPLLWSLFFIASSAALRAKWEEVLRCFFLSLEGYRCVISF